MIIRIEDCKEIDGKKYYTLASYVNGEKDEAEYGTYFSEDCEEKKVYCNYINHTGEINTSVYFDFVNPLKGNISGRDIWDEPIYPTTYEAFGRSYNAFECGDQKRYRLVEGLGFISSEKLENIDYAQCLGTILTGPILGCTGYCTIPKIYEIVNGAGEVLYYLPSARPGAHSASNREPRLHRSRSHRFWEWYNNLCIQVWGQSISYPDIAHSQYSQAFQS